MNSDFEYYIMRRKNDKAYPLVKITDYTDDLIKLAFNSPIPKEPVMADFLSAPKVVISKRIAELMKKLDMEGVQFIPTILTDEKGDSTETYLCVLLENNIYPAMDKKQSDYIFQNECYTINRFILDKDILSNIPLKQRLGFCLQEAPGYSLFHKTVIDAISNIEPTGVYFKNIEEYNF